MSEASGTRKALTLEQSIYERAVFVITATINNRSKGLEKAAESNRSCPSLIVR